MLNTNIIYIIKRDKEAPKGQRGRKGLAFQELPDDDVLLFLPAVDEKGWSSFQTEHLRHLGVIFQVVIHLVNVFSGFSRVGQEAPEEPL